MKHSTLSGNLTNRHFRSQYKVSRSKIVEIISALLILLFIYTAISKILDYQNFRLQLGKSPFITRYAGLLSWALPSVEILVGIALSLKRFRNFGLYVALSLMTSFTAYIYIMLNYSYYLPCSCGGVLAMMSWNQHFWFNLTFVILSIIGIYLNSSDKTKVLLTTSNI